ncbi:hypothetical protein LOY55_28180 [Pseudomonas sp. B21-040]|uniref:hypothetical protein n=1 Tax=unclassified Pseudomonas TaxID=196821 RepID=UPI001CBCA6B7|nr:MULTISPECIES: hypothetical protein [unclassified Pseudomonas]UVL40038.1 hypothetical protein LOY55_28180 [Pseudomonas sp. B21-040]
MQISDKLFLENNTLTGDVPTNEENLGIKPGDTIEDHLNPKTSVRFKMWRVSEGKIFLSTIAVGGPVPPETGELWKAPENEPETRTAMLSLNSGDIIMKEDIMKEDKYYKVLHNEFRYPINGANTVVYVGAQIEPIEVDSNLRQILVNANLLAK